MGMSSYVVWHRLSIPADTLRSKWGLFNCAFVVSSSVYLFAGASGFPVLQFLHCLLSSITCLLLLPLVRLNNA